MADKVGGARSRLDRTLVEPGLWVETTGRSDFPSGSAALFLDRDGTINVDTDYPSDPAEIELRPAILPVISLANRSNMPVVIVSNQSGIARGYFGWAEFAAVNDRVLKLLREQGCTIDLVVACAYHPEGSGALAVADHPMRKPNAGMLRLASDRLGLDLAGSIIVGDKTTDMEAGRRAGLAGGWLIGGEPSGFGDFEVVRLSEKTDYQALLMHVALLGQV
jgi:D-glycero-D-manno-heptose 1,7-bisphosphate phosphatase